MMDLKTLHMHWLIMNINESKRALGDIVMAWYIHFNFGPLFEMGWSYSPVVWAPADARLV